MEWIVLILWSILTLIAGKSFGKYQAEQELEARPKQEFSTVIHGEPEVTKAELEALYQRLGLVDAQLQVVDEKIENAPTTLSMGAERRLAEVESLMNRVTELEKKDETYNERFRRVERKAGMSV